MNTTINSHTNYSSPVYHAPLIVDVATQKVYRRWGHVSRPKKDTGIRSRIIKKIRGIINPSFC